MNLSEYFSSGKDTLGAAALARAIGVNSAIVYQWRTGRRPVPIEHCAAIEIATQGEVSRRDLRPDDCERIWPELAAKEPANATSEEVA
jgi:DNA-binding transcriptional regulator YdaS (Cro superfamily)